VGFCFEGIERLGREYPEALKANPVGEDPLMTWMGKAPLYDFAGAVMYVLHEVLGSLSEDKMIVPMDVKRGKLLPDEILSGGN
jgi:hypothetical protein